MSFNIENYLSDQQAGKVILFYKGNIDSDLINHVLDSVESKMVEADENSKMRKKVYNVLVESLQNLFHHVDKVPEDFEDQASDKFGLLQVEKTDVGYKITTGNFVCTENVPEARGKDQLGSTGRAMKRLKSFTSSSLIIREYRQKEEEDLGLLI
jgi:hypothetical protein